MEQEMTMVEKEYLEWAGERIAQLEAVVEAARELRQSWREDGQGSVQECNALKKLHEALDNESESV